MPVSDLDSPILFFLKMRFLQCRSRLPRDRLSGMAELVILASLRSSFYRKVFSQNLETFFKEYLE